MKNICEKCKKNAYLQAFSTGTCKICGKHAVTPHIPSYELCNKCTEETKLCQQCGKEI